MKYKFVGYLVEQDSTIDIPVEAIVVGGNFLPSGQWQITALVPLMTEFGEEAEEEEAEEEEEKEDTEDAEIPSES
jgi:hypothetical protein